MANQQVVVVGAGLAALKSLEALRRNGYTGAATVIGAERYDPYNRPPLTKAALHPGFDFANLRLPTRGDTADWRLRSRVLTCDLDRRLLTVTGGAELAFDGIVFASGLKARRPWGTRPGAHSVRTLDDAQRLARALLSAPRVAVLGAGFLGCEVATTARLLGCVVTLIAPESQPLERQLGAEVGGAVGRRLQALGIELLLGRDVLAYRGDSPSRISTSHDETVFADVVIEALGSSPSVDWISTPGLDTSDGIETDSWLRILSPDGVPYPCAVAAGDVARYPHPLWGAVPRRVEHWGNAVDTGRCAGRTLASALNGADPEATPREDTLPSFWTELGGVRLDGHGIPAIADAGSVLHGDLTGEFVYGYFLMGRPVGVVGLGMTRQVQAFAPQIRDAWGG